MSGIAWGGSEELWWRTARWLQCQGHAVVVNYKWWPEPARQLRELIEEGGEIFWREGPPLGFWARHTARLRSWFGNGTTAEHWLESSRPDCVLITLGYHPDRIFVADECQRLGIPYAINVQSASHFFFIHGDLVPQYRNWYQGARRVFFVSEENQHKLETNLAIRLSNAEIVDNPFNIDRNIVVDWPPEDATWRLACVGRVHFQSKGQDLIVEVMRRDKWRQRNLEILFFGKDQGNAFQLKDLIALHGLQEQLRFVGFDEDMSAVWKRCHGLILPSRYEGAALVIVEAMLARRMCITTDTGRNRELIDEGQTGFIAPAATADMLDEAMERAWQARSRWLSMGELAGEHIRQRYSADPIADFASRLTRLTQSD